MADVDLSLAQIADRLYGWAERQDWEDDQAELRGLAAQVRRHAEQEATVDDVLAAMHVATDEPVAAAVFVYESWQQDRAERDALSTLLRGMARRAGEMRRWGRRCCREAIERAAEYDALARQRAAGLALASELDRDADRMTGDADLDLEDQETVAAFNAGVASASARAAARLRTALGETASR